MKPRILCYGDSNTYGYDPRSYLGGRYPASVRWTALLRAAGWEVLNHGQNGRRLPRTAQEAEEEARLLQALLAEWTIVMLGSNDLLQGLSAEACEARMEALLRALGTGGRLLLVAPPPMVPGPWAEDRQVREESRRLGPCYQALAERLEGVAFADAGAWGVELSYDGVHFSEAGHRAFAAGMAAALEELFLDD